MSDTNNPESVESRARECDQKWIHDDEDQRELFQVIADFARQEVRLFIEKVRGYERGGTYPVTTSDAMRLAFRELYNQEL